MRLVLDTSATIKRYAIEDGAEALERLLDDAAEVFVSRLCCIEFVSTIRKLMRSYHLSEDLAATVLQHFDRDCLAIYRALPVTDSLVEATLKSVRSTPGLPLLASDAIHIQTALHADVDAFVTADGQQGAAAEALGLEVRRL